MKSKNIAFAVAMAALLNVPMSELTAAHAAFVADFKDEAGK